MTGRATAVAMFFVLMRFGAAYAQPPNALQNVEDSCLRAALASARKVIAAPRVGSEFEGSGPQIDISRDGSEVAYTVVEPDIGQNIYGLSLWITSTAGHEPPKRVADEGSSNTLVPIATPRFSPDGRKLAYFTQSAGQVHLVVMDLATGRSKQFGGTAPDDGTAHWAIRTTTGLEWSPDGQVLAFGIVERPSTHPDHAPHGVETGTRWAGEVESKERSGLALLRLSDGMVRKILEPGLYVYSFDWSPDGERIAISAGAQSILGYERFMYTDIYLLDLRSQHLSPLVVQPGRDDDPRWSPDGLKVAFSSSGGFLDWTQKRILAYVIVSTGQIIYPQRSPIESLSGAVDSPPSWSADGRSLLVRLRWKLRSAVYEVPIEAGALRSVTGDDLASYYDVRLSAGGRTVAYTQQMANAPSDVFVSSTDRFEPRQITQFSKAFRRTFGDGANAEMVSWPSTDRRWTIHGALISGAACAARRRPLLVFVLGGPTMIRADFNLDAQFPLLAFAQGGVTILAPNTRGREGFGRPFLMALAHEGHWGSGPLSDILAGIDHVEAERCVARSGDIGIVGHSYGGYLTAYTITQTRRFRAAVIFDAAGPPLFADEIYRFASNTTILAVLSQLYGLTAPFSANGYAAIQRESPLPQMGNVRTPTLLEFGNAQLGGSDAKNGLDLFQTLQHYGVPSRFIRYLDIGHRVSESSPALQLDSARRVLEWYWYWVLGDPVPDLVHEFGLRSRQALGADSLCDPSSTHDR